jgi:hypothetical protein
MISMSLQEMHDQLVTQRPEGASCPEDCPFCAGTYKEESHMGGNNVSDKTYSEDEVKAQVAAAVAEAVAPLQSELDKFRLGEETAAVEARITELRAELEAQVADLTSKLDAAVIEAQTAKQERDDIEAWLKAEDERVRQETEAASRRDTRIAQVAEVVTFPGEYVQERADKWASLSEEEFETLLADYKALAEKAGAPGTESPLPTATAMQAAREPSGTTKLGSAALELIRGRNVGLDPRTIR